MRPSKLQRPLDHPSLSPPEERVGMRILRHDAKGRLWAGTIVAYNHPYYHVEWDGRFKRTLRRIWRTLTLAN